jgi:uridine phosphorylase
MAQIPDSELIINPRGAIYHLDVRPEEIAPTIVLVGDPDRVSKVSQHFDRIEHKLHHREFNTHTGYIGKKRISVVSTGIGPDNIDIALNEIDALVNIDFETREIKKEFKSLHILRFGTSGSLQPEIPVDSLVAGTHGLGLDNVLNYYKYQKSSEEQALAAAFVEQTGMSHEITHPYVFEGSAELLSHFGSDYHKGITVTCPGFYGPQGRVLRLDVNIPGLIENLYKFRYGNHRISNFEMETSAIYGLGRLLGHQCLSLNTIVANRVLKQFSKDGNAAVDNLIKTSLGILSGIKDPF